MKGMSRAALLVAACVVALPLSARAEIREGSIEVSPFVGYNFFENDQNLKDEPVFGGRFGYNFTKHLGIEAVMEFIGSGVDDQAITGAREGQYRGPVHDVDLTFYHIDAVYHFMPDNRLTPFVVAGFGGAHSSPEISTKDMAAFNVGVGAKYQLAENLALRVDLQDYMITEIAQETYHNVGATVGLTFSFGGKSKPVQYEAKPAPVYVEPVVVVVAEPKAEEKVIVIAAAPKVAAQVIVLAFEDIHFDFDKATLKPEAKTILKRNITLLKENPKAKVRIAGYTSASGSAEYNQKLSERRASAVKDYLISEGIITPDRLDEIGYGESKPAIYEAAPQELYSKAAKANMRVLFEIIVR